MVPSNKITRMTFEEAVASATRLETLERTKVPGKITGAAAEVKEESKQNDQVTELVDRFGIVLARLESMPPQGKKTGENYQSRPYPRAPAAEAAGGEGKTRELSTKEAEETTKNKEGYSYKGNNYRRWEYDRRKYCIAHQKAGHATESCVAKSQTKRGLSSHLI